jgi:subtilisin family serine protease
MKFLKVSALVLFFLLTSSYTFAAKNYVDGELLVKFKDGVYSARANTANSILGAKLLESFPTLGWQRVQLPDGMSLYEGMSFYEKFDGIESIQPNFIYHQLATPNDPQFTASGMYGLNKISAPAAWDITTGNSSIVVADIDSGMRLTHPDLVANKWVNTGEIAGNGIDDDNNGYADDVNGYDFYFNDADPNDVDNGIAGSHGTHTAGTMGAVGNNATGVVGINWNVKIMVVKIFNNAEAPNDTTTSAMLINAYSYIRMMKDRGVHIVATNNSYGGCSEACGFDQATKDALDALGDDQILTVFAAGNDAINIDNSPSYPASYTSPTVISVASSTSTDARSSFSSFGVASVDLAAPGSGILSTIPPANYGSLSGTSMATPHVTGALALLASSNQSLSAASLKASILNNVDVLANWNGVVKTGGRLNVLKAIQNPTVCTFTPSQNSLNAAIGGGAQSFTVTAPTNCDYSVKSDSAWITVSSGNPGSGNGTVNFTVQSNAGGSARTGHVNFGGQSVTVNQAGLAIATHTVLDFDGDGKTDYVAIQNTGGGMTWHILRSTQGYTVATFGTSATDVAVPADYDGDGKTDIAVWRGGVVGTQGFFYVVNSSDGSITINAWGSTGDDPRMVQDFDGDGKADLTVVRKAGGVLNWYIFGTTIGVRIYQFGTDMDLPLRGDFDGDHKADPAVYRPASGTPGNTFFSLNSTSGNLQAVTFGTSSIDKIVPADFDGDGKTDIAVWRNTDGNWYYLLSSNGSFHAIPFGIGGTDLPTPGDYDGDGKTDFAVWRPNPSPGSSGTFYIFTQQSAFTGLSWGNSDMLIPANSLQVRN